MQSTKVQQKIQKLINEILPLFGNVKTIVEALSASGGRALLVGGAVRDLLLDRDVKDLDIEIHGLPLTQVETILKRFGHVRTVGKQFGVLKIDGIDVDWSLPRFDGAGRKPTVTVDPYMNSKDAFSRRDLTVNAMGIDLVTLQLEDPFNGAYDLENKILRAPDPEKFKEDPLRFFRVMQFVGRLEMYPSDELNQLCKEMDLSKIAQERIHGEFEKLFVKSQKPSLGIQWLQDIGRLKEILPELYDTIGVEQEPDWHPEGDVFEHTKQAMDAAAQKEYETPEKKFIMVLALVCHDLGKAVTTQVLDGRIRALKHDIKGIPLALSLTERVTGKLEIQGIIKKLVKYHMIPGQFIKNNAGPGAYKRMAKKLYPETNCEELALLALCDKCGRNPEKGSPLPDCRVPDVEEFLEAAKKYKVEHNPEEPVLTGKDIIEYIKPGPKMGRALAIAYKLQVSKGITDKETLRIAAIGKKKKKDYSS